MLSFRAVSFFFFFFLYGVNCALLMESFSIRIPDLLIFLFDFHSSLWILTGELMCLNGREYFQT